MYLPYVSSWSGPQPESFMVGVNTDSDPASFTWYGEVVSSNDAWALYTEDLSGYADKTYMLRLSTQVIIYIICMLTI